MIVTELYDGQGLGNQLWCYVVTRVIALDKGYKFGIKSPEKFKGGNLFDIDFGEKVIDGTGPEGGPPRSLPKGIKSYYNERQISHPNDGTDIRTHDENLVRIPNNTKIDGIMQDEQYILHRKKEISSWLKIKKDSQCSDFSDENVCIINFRGGEYVHIEKVFLTHKYWFDAMNHMRKINPHLRFIVITDDVRTARKFFPRLDVFHFSIEKDYSIINSAKYLILSNSSFAWFPAWLNKDLKACIAPKYWARHNVDDGIWGCSYNITSGWKYLAKDGQLYSYEESSKELSKTIENHDLIFSPPKIKKNFLMVSNYYNDLSWVPELCDDYVIYDQSSEDIYPPLIDRTKIKKTPHLGHNVRDYCSYIVDNYNNLPERIIFCSGNVFPRHVSREFFIKVMNNTFFTPIEDYRRHREKWPWSFFSSDGGYCELNNNWYLGSSSPHPTKFFDTYNDFLSFCFKDPILPRYIRFAPGANYIVSKDQIRKYPKVFYENLRNFVSHSSTSIPGESHIIERSLYTIWNCNFLINDAMNKKISANSAKFSYSLSSKSMDYSQILNQVVIKTKYFLNEIFINLKYYLNLTK